MKSRLKEIIEDRGIKQSFVCRNVGISPTTMSKLCNGGVPTLQTAIRIAKVLGLTVEEIWYEE